MDVVDVMSNACYRNVCNSFFTSYGDIADHLSLLCFLMNSRYTKVTVMASFSHSNLLE